MKTPRVHPVPLRAAMPQFIRARVARAFWCLALSAGALSTLAATVHETHNEFIASGDFNGDGLPDALVLDKVTGNARIGYQSGGGVLSWSQPFTNGVAHPTGVGIGRFIASDRDAIAVTAPDFNRVALMDVPLSGGDSAPIIINAAPDASSGIGPLSLAGLAAPTGTNGPFDQLLVASSFNPAPPNRLNLLGLDLGAVASSQEYLETAPLERLNPLPISSNVTFAIGIARGSNDVLHLWRFTNAPGLAAVSSNLPAGSEYTFGRFYLEPWPRFITYTPGSSNLTVFALEWINTEPRFGAAQTYALDKAIHGVFYSDMGTNWQLWVQFEDGILGARPPSGTGQLQTNFWLGAGPGNAPAAVIGLGVNQAAFLYSVSNSGLTDFARVFAYNGTTWTAVSSNALPRVTTGTTRANVWLFTSEPFVNPNAALVATLSAPDWTRHVISMPGNLSVAVESDGGAVNGLGDGATNNLGAPPAGAVFGTPNQYHPAISLFGYSSAMPPDPVVVSISPAPGTYRAPVQITFSKQNPTHTVRYRLAHGAEWLTYSAPFSLTNNTTVQFYGEHADVRGRLQFASYSISGGGDLPPASTVVLPGSDTNPPPVFNTNAIFISQSGTVVYGRRSPLGALHGMLGPTPYTAFTQSPFARTNGFTYFYLEDFEDSAFNTPGAAPSQDWGVAQPGLGTDSVDPGGRSFFSAFTQTNLTVTFNAAALGGNLPTHAGIVWTDVGGVTSGTPGFGNVIFTARDANGVPLGTNIAVNLGNGSGVASSADDRFFGIVHAGGISSISISMPNSVDWEVDHVQYGRLPPDAFQGEIWAIDLDGSGESFVTTGSRPRVSLVVLPAREPSGAGSTWPLGPRARDRIGSSPAQQQRPLCRPRLDGRQLGHHLRQRLLLLAHQLHQPGEPASVAGRLPPGSARRQSHRRTACVPDHLARNHWPLPRAIERDNETKPGTQRAQPEMAGMVPGRTANRDRQ